MTHFQPGNKRMCAYTSPYLIHQNQRGRLKKKKKKRDEETMADLCDSESNPSILM